MPEEKIEAIEPIDEFTQVAEIEEPVQRAQPDKEKFDQAFASEQKTTAPIHVEPAQNKKASLMDTVRDLNYKEFKGTAASHQSLLSQTKEAVQQIEEIKKSLEAPNVSIKSSARQLLNSKLSHIDESLRVALSKAGIEYNPTASQEESKRVNPIERFLSFLTDGQWQLERLGEQLGYMAHQGKELSPVNMLAIQVKVGQIQQELDLFSSLLSKGLESIKTIMNIQV